MDNVRNCWPAHNHWTARLLLAFLIYLNTRLSAIFSPLTLAASLADVRSPAAAFFHPLPEIRGSAAILPLIVQMP